jgi:hypothetical protein
MIMNYPETHPMQEILKLQNEGRGEYGAVVECNKGSTMLISDGIWCSGGMEQREYHTYKGRNT